MKKIIILSFVLVLILMSSCNDDFLERPPQGSIAVGSYPSTSNEAIAATNAVYNTLRIWQFNSGGFPLLDIMSDEARKGSNPGDGTSVVPFDNFTYTPTEGGIENWYRTLYLGIRRSYLVLESVPSIEMDDDLKTRLIAETRFLLGYFYSLLVRGFGDVPLVTSSVPPTILSRTASEEIYQQIIFPDLEFAADNLPKKSEYSNDDIGRITSGAAKALLARLYLYRKDYTNAEKYSLEVINSLEYGLESNFVDAFSVAGEFGTESVFEIGALPYGSLSLGGNQYANTQGVRGTPNYGWGFARPSYQWITDMMNDTDPRIEPSIIFLNEVIDDIVIVGDPITPDTTYTDASNTQILEIEAYNQKVYAGTSNQDQWGHNRRIIRYADVLLMAAEALNENNKPNDALVYINEVRSRARAGNLGVLPDIVTTDKSQLRNAIYNERAKELFMEGLRFWDLIRTDRAESILGPLGFIKDKNEIFPIPQSEIDISGGVIIQNPNY